MTSAGCRICGDPRTVTSHLLPRAFVFKIRGNDPTVNVTDLVNERTDLTQAGTFVRDILCECHEALLSSIDGYAVRFCADIDPERLPPMRSGRGVVFDNVDGDKLVRFACAVLWRSHYADRREVAGVNVGPHISRLESVAFHGDLSQAPNVYLYLPRSVDLDVRELMSLPAGKRVGTLRRWSFLCGGINFLIDLSEGKSGLEQYRINSKTRATVFMIDFDRSGMRQEWASMLELSKNGPGPFRSSSGRRDWKWFRTK